MPSGRFLLVSLLTACICFGGAPASTSFAQKASVPRKPDRFAIASEKAKELLPLMDTNKNGKISKQEWMRFMEAVFNRLDTNKAGEIDPKQILSHDKTTAFDNR